MNRSQEQLSEYRQRLNNLPSLPPSLAALAAQRDLAADDEAFVASCVRRICQEIQATRQTVFNELPTGSDDFSQTEFFDPDEEAWLDFECEMNRRFPRRGDT
ncbi:MAG: hypothetical protein KDA42_17640 [Planctomycetales bacterium]|nr:hypothetical protein [Planctomycetales bacterium]